MDALEVGVHVGFSVGPVDEATDGGHEFAQRLDVLLVGVLLLVEQLHDARVHDARGEHLLLEELADEADVTQHASTRIPHAVLAVLNLAALLEVELLGRLGLGGHLALLLLLDSLLLLLLSLARRLLLSLVNLLLLHSLDVGVALLELLLALVQQHALKVDHSRPTLGLRVTVRVHKLDALGEEPVAQVLAHRRVQLRERGLGESLVEQLGDEADERPRLVDALGENLLEELLKILRCELVEDRLERALLLLLAFNLGLIDREELVLRLLKLG